MEGNSLWLDLYSDCLYKDLLTGLNSQTKIKDIVIVLHITGY